MELTAKTFGAEASLEWLASVPVLINDENMTDAVFKYIEETDGLNIIESYDISMGSEDFSLIADKVPGVYISLVCVGDENGDHPNSHGPFIVYDESKLCAGAAAMAKIASSWLNDNPSTGDK